VTLFATLYTDEDMSALVATLLRSGGLDVTTVPEQATLGKTDREQLEFATSLGSRTYALRTRKSISGSKLKSVETD
jgi:hypothetical protein